MVERVSCKRVVYPLNPGEVLCQMVVFERGMPQDAIRHKEGPLELRAPGL